MNRTIRGPTPELLAQHGAQIGLQYAQRRRENPSYRYQWPQRGGERLDHVALVALRAMTDGHCSYCDASEINATGEEQIDHFCPKTLPQFYELVCTWSNLFLTCMACNKAKHDAWHELLLRPDDDGYDFERYLEFDFLTGELLANGAASTSDRARAAKTIELLNLNRTDACKNRPRMVREIRRAVSAGEPIDVGYRFLIALCMM